MLGGRRVNMNGIRENNCLEKHCNIPVFLKIVDNCFSSCCGSKKMQVSLNSVNKYYFRMTRFNSNCCTVVWQMLL